MIKKYYFILLAMTVLSCSKIENDNTISETHHFSINAVLDELGEDSSTKAAGIDVIRLEWAKGDQVSVVNVTTGKALGGDLTADAEGTSSVFSGNLTGTIRQGDKLAFIYPCQHYTGEATFQNINVDCSLQNSAGPSLVMLAHHTVGTETNVFTGINVSFKFQTAFMNVYMSQLPVSTEITSTQINGVNDFIELHISDDEMVSTSVGVNNYIRYTSSFTTSSRGTKSFFVSIPPSPGTSRTITATTETGAYDSYFTNADLQINNYYSFIANGFDKISFADPVVEQYCLDNFDYDHDSRISFAEAMSVESFPSILTKAATSPIPTGITSFTELKYFKGLTSYPCFNGYTSLTAVSVPEQITSIPDNCFKECIALSKIIMYPTTPPTLGTDVFTETNATVYVPENSVTAYQSADGWENNDIQNLSHVDDDQVISIPDANFKAFLVEYYDTDGDGEISKGEAGVVEEISLDTRNVTSLEGIQYFTALKELDCQSNQVTSLDVRSNTALNRLVCCSNQLASLDVSRNTGLILLNCAQNSITSLDVSNNKVLELLYIVNNQLTDINVRSNKALTDLICEGNKLTSLDVSKNPALLYLNCGQSNIPTLDVSKNPALLELKCKQCPYLTQIWLKEGQKIANFVYDTDVASVGYKNEMDENTIIYYTSTDGNTVTPVICKAQDEYGDDLTFTNTYAGGVGALEFDGTVKNITITFTGDTRLESIDSVTNMMYLNDASQMFSGCTSLIYADMTNFNTQNSMSMDYMFQSCSSLGSLKVGLDTNKGILNSSAFSGIKSNGTLYYPYGSDYSSWLSSDHLGKYGWTGETYQHPGTGDTENIIYEQWSDLI